MTEQIILSTIPVADLVNSITTSVLEEVSLLISVNKPEPPQHPPKFISRKEAADLIGVTLPTLSAYTRDGRIPGYRIGRRVRYKEVDVTAALSRITTTSKGRPKKLYN